MHPVDAIVHGVLAQREAGRAKEQHEWQVRAHVRVRAFL